MTDTSSNNNAHLQNKLVKDSIDHNQDISAQILRAQTAASVRGRRWACGSQGDARTTADGAPT